MSIAIAVDGGVADRSVADAMTDGCMAYRGVTGRRMPGRMVDHGAMAGGMVRHGMMRCAVMHSMPAAAAMMDADRMTSASAAASAAAVMVLSPCGRTAEQRQRRGAEQDTLHLQTSSHVKNQTAAP
jgi:hypothetical protein